MALYKMYFSPTGNVRKIVKAFSKGVSKGLKSNKINEQHLKEELIDITPLKGRVDYEFQKDDVVVIGFPIYAGRLPNKLVYYFDHLKGNGAKAIGIVSYGCRSFGDGLVELDINLRNSGFDVCGLMAVPSAHSFAAIGVGRPTDTEFNQLEQIGFEISEGGFQSVAKDKAPGNNPPGPYYRPLEEDGSFADFLKAKPVTDEELCDDCRMCVKVCPMGSIDEIDVTSVPGICIKCQGCVNICHKNAKYFDHSSFLSHKRMLERDYSANWPELTVVMTSGFKA